MHTSHFRLHLAAIVLLSGAGMLADPPAAQARSDGMDQMPMDMEGGQNHQHAHAAGFSFGAPAKAAQASRTVKITMADMSFQPTDITVRTGETVRFLVTNTSTIDHEFTLGDDMTEQAHRKEMAEMMAQGGSMAHDDPNAITVESGKTRELTWRFTHAGRLEFDCNVPGHYEAGMKGLITVR
jgi:uncharacterized cupredoxin-like copper-binding protein